MIPESHILDDMQARIPLTRKITIAVSFALLGLAANYLDLPVSYGVSFIFGSVFTIIAVGLLGPWWGGFVALTASSYTYLLWSHPYAIVIFSFEALWVGIALRRGKKNIFLIDALYWLIVGSPLVVVFYGGIMHMEAQATTVIVLKQTINGLFNALLAAIILSHTSIGIRLGIRQSRPRTTHAHLLFLVVAVFITAYSLVMIALENQRRMAFAQEQIATDIHAEALEVGGAMRDWVGRLENAARIIATLGSTEPMEPSAKLQQELEQIHALFPDFHNVFLADATATTIGFHPTVNEKGQSTIGISFADRAWFKELSSTLQPVVSDVFFGRGGVFKPIFTISVPVVKDGKLSHFGLGAANLEWMQYLFDERAHNREGLFFTIIDRNGKVVFSTYPPRKPLDEFTGQGTGQIKNISSDVALFIPEVNQNSSTIKVWGNSYYFTRLPLTGTPWTLQVEFPVEHLQQAFYADTIQSLALLAGFFTVIIGLAALISRFITQPMIALAKLSKNLPRRIENQEEIVWPQTNSLEMSEMIDNFRQTSDALAYRIREIKDSNLQLEETVKKRTADLLKERQRLADIIEGANVGIWEWNVQTGETNFNQRWAQIIGYDLAELEPVSLQTWLDQVHPDDLKASTANLERHFSGELPFYECECRMRHKNGTWIWVYDHGRVTSWTDDGKPLLMLGVHQDVTERVRVDVALRNSMAFIDSIIEQSPLSMWVADDKGMLIRANQALRDYLQLTDDEIIGRYCIFNDSQVEAQGFMPKVRDVFNKGISARFTLTYDTSLVDLALAKTVKRFLEVSISPVVDSEGKVTNAIVQHLDITNIKQSQEELYRVNQQLSSIVESTRDVVAMMDTEYRYTQFNTTFHDEFEKIFGQDLKRGDSMLQALAHMPEDLATAQEFWRRALGGEDFIVTQQFGSIERERNWYELHFSPIRDSKGRVVGAVHIVRNVTERRNAEELKERLLQEKTVMLQEIHHRVKNNLTVVYSLLSLQAQGIADAAIRAKFEESRNRVFSMSLIHQKLYQSEDLAHVDFKEYLQSLVGGIAETYSRPEIIITVDMESVALDVNVGIPCGLIVNELVSNCLKYAFPEGRTGVVRVGINSNNDGTYVLFVADNGIGFPTDIDFQNTSSLGLQLVNGLTSQIRGTIELAREGGTSFRITFRGNPDNRGKQNG